MNKSSLQLMRSAVVALIVLEAFLPLSARASDRLVASARSVLQTKLLEPLQKKENDRSRFSRAALPPSARRIRILDDTPQTDGKGRPFLQFAVDESRAFGVVKEKEGTEADWFRNAIMGCVYPETGDVMVRRGEVYYTSSVLLGRTTPMAPTDVCRPR